MRRYFWKLCHSDIDKQKDNEMNKQCDKKGKRVSIHSNLHIVECWAIITELDKFGIISKKKRVLYET